MTGMNNKFDLTTGSVTKNLLRAALPMIIAMVVETGYNIVDTIFVGRLGPDAIAAVTLAFPVMFVMMAVGMGVATGASALIARAVGAKQYKEADNIAEHSMITGIILSIVFTVVGLLTMRPVFELMGAGPTVIGPVMSYTGIIYYGSIFLFLSMMAGATLRGVGDMKTQMNAMVIGAVLNIIMDPIFIFVFGMGVKGAAVATILSRIVACIYMYRYLFAGKTVIKLSPKDFSFNWSHIRSIFATGLPMSATQVIMAVSWGMLARIASLYGPIAIAAYGIGFRVETVVFFPLMGLGIALITVVGQNLGAGKPERAKESILTALGMGTVFMMVSGAFFYAFAAPTVRIFSSDPLLIQYASSFIMTISPAYFFVAVGMLIGSAILGTGNAIPHLIMTSIRVLVLAVPLAYVLSVTYGFGLLGLWWGITISTVISGFISIVWYHFIDWDAAVVRNHSSS